MKTSLLIPLFFLMTSLIFSQEKIVTSGGNSAGSGSVSYTVGQIFVNVNVGKNGSVSEGIQQSIELFTLSNPELTAINLKAITYPNPTKDRIILSLSDNNLLGLSYTVFDINGRLLVKGTVKKDKTTIPMKNFATGIYLLKVHQNSKQLQTFKIIKN